MRTQRQLNALDARTPAGRNLLLLGLWMRSAIVGTALVVAGLASLIAPPHGLPLSTALTWIIAGGALARLAWKRTAALLSRVDADEPDRPERDDVSRQRQPASVPAAS